MKEKRKSLGAQASSLPHRRQDACGPRKSNRRGMTLVELMIVSGIILMLVVISVPVVRPMLTSRKQADAAQILSIYLNSARIRAGETGRDCGVMFERYTDNGGKYPNGDQYYPNNDSCLIVRQVEVPTPYMGMSDNVRVSVAYDAPGNNKVANITFHEWINGGWSASSSEDVYWNKMVQKGDKIQFDNQGPYYTIVSAFSDMNSDISKRKFPQIAIQQQIGTILGNTDRDFNVIRPIPADSPVSFKLYRTPKNGDTQLTLTPPVGFPSGIIVDLQYSGINSFGEPSHNENGEPPKWAEIGSDFWPKKQEKPDGSVVVGADTDPVIVMFSPSGAVSLIRNGTTVSIDGPIHFLIGRWDRAGSSWEHGVWPRPDRSPYPPEDELRNYQDLSNFWVTVDHNTGRVRTNPVATSDIYDLDKKPLFESRRYANQSQ